MPLFMALVGYFATNLLKDSLVSALAKKARQLLLPALTFGIILIVYMSIRGGYHGIIAKTIKWDLWFLKSAFICTMLYYISFSCCRKKIWLGALASLIISQVLTITCWRFSLMYPSFLLGVLFHIKEDWIRRHSGTIAALGGILLVIMLLPWDEQFWIGKKQDDIQSEIIYDLFRRAYRIAIGLVGTTFFFALFRWLSKKAVWKNLFDRMGGYGKETLGIYCLQTFIIEEELKRYLNFDDMGFIAFNFVVTPCISVIVLVICLWVIQYIRKSRLLSFLCLGSKWKVIETIK